MSSYILHDLFYFVLMLYGVLFKTFLVILISYQISYYIMSKLYDFMCKKMHFFIYLFVETKCSCTEPRVTNSLGLFLRNVCFDVGANTGSDAPIGRFISVWFHSSPRDGDSPSLTMQPGLWKQIMWTDCVILFIQIQTLGTTVSKFI